MTILDQLGSTPIQAWIPTLALERGALLVSAGRLSRPRIGAGKVVADAHEPRAGRVRTEIRSGALGPAAQCSCDAPQPCAHAAALALLLVGDACLPARTGAGSLEDQEREIRRDRGRSGLFKVTRGEQAGHFCVGSPSGRGYQVVLRARELPHNGCSCEDFATNQLGTCKHIEAVLCWIAKRRAESPAPPHSYLFVAPGAVAEVGLAVASRAGPGVTALATRWFDRGRLRVPLAGAWPELSRAAERARVEIPAEVRALAARQLAREAQKGQGDRLAADVRHAGREQPGFRGRLYPYQVEGVAFLVSRGRALLADDMGLGKTAQTIAAMVRLFGSGDVRRALIVCPASLKHQWADELRRFASPELQVKVVSGSWPSRQAIYREPGQVIITSYELLRGDEHEVAGMAPDLLVLDEAQRLKNWRTRTADAAKRVKAPYAFVLTGTPLENRLDDLYSLMQIVDPHVLGPLWGFNRDFVTRDGGGRASGYHNLAELRRRLAPHVLRRRKQEVLAQLPEVITSRLVLPMDEAQRAIHGEAEQTVARLLSIIKRRPLSPIEEQRLMRAFQRMRMACDAAALCGDDRESSPKLAELERLFEEICLDSDRKIVVFTEWQRMQALAAEVASRLGIGHVRLHGGVPAQQRGGLIERFRSDPGCRIFFSTDAGGVGLNLQAASCVINLDMPWNPAVLAQRIGRVHRLGQKRAVNVVLMLAEGSIETRMETTLSSKRQLFEAAIGDDAETVTLERTTLARRLTTLLGESFAASTGPARPPAPVVLVARPVTSSGPAATGEWRMQCLATSDRKLAAARTLLAGGQPGEALALVHGGLLWSCRAACDRDPGEDAALMVAVYRDLIPRGALQLDDAHALARAGELTRAFGGSPIEPPPDLVEAQLACAIQLAIRLRQRLPSGAALPHRLPARQIGGLLAAPTSGPH